MSHAFAVGGLVHNQYAKADGVVVALSDSPIHVRVTATLGDLYKVGYEYAWLPRHLVCLDALN